MARGPTCARRPLGRALLSYTRPLLSFYIFCAACRRDLQPACCEPRRAPAPVPSRSTFLPSNRNSYSSSRPTPTETSHLGADLAGCAQPSDLPPSLSRSSRAACCSPSNHNHTLPCASHSSLGIALPSLFFPPPFYSLPYRGHPGECQQSLPISGCSLLPAALPLPSSTLHHLLLDAEHNGGI